MMRLKSLCRDLEYTTEGGLKNISINNVVCDSRLVKNKDLFVAISGETQDGHDYLKDAVKRGASCAIIERDVDVGGIEKIKVSDTRKALALLARNLHRDPSKDIKTIGITGTNGKTTVSYLLESILKKAHRRVGVIGTIRYQIGDEVIAAGNTTPFPLMLQGFIRKMVDRSLEYCIMEVSSHALDQHRTDYIDFDAAIFTNATREHLDYHKTFKKYLDSKMTLFGRLKTAALSIINKDDPNFDKVRKASPSKRVITFGIRRGADLYADRVELKAGGTTFNMHTNDGIIPVNSNLIGTHNISNMLAAASFAVSEGIGLDIIKEALEDIREIPGRLQLVDTPSFIKIFVDYAHTEDALHKVLTTLGRLKQNRIITVFGCGGNRDRGKRPRMGRIAVELSDYVVITSDNPRYEEPQTIADEIVRGIEKGFSNYKIILDRRIAIEEALLNAENGDIVLIAGKGHEEYQVVRDNKIPFDDRKVAREFFDVRRKCLL